MNKEVARAILKTLCYSDIFDYPLTKEEILRFLIGKNISRAEFEKEFESTPLGCNRNFYYLLGRGEIAEKRIRREKESRRKLEFAKRIIQKLSFIPTVLFIGVSGGLALGSSEKDEDIDIFVITRTNSIWITRLLLVLMLILLGQYRGRGKKESQKVCLNMLIDEEALKFKQQDLYTAHEIVQLKPVFDRNNTYEKFVNANKWVKEFLPNSMVIKKLSNKIIKERKHNYIITNLLNYFAKALQLWYMKKHRTKEIVENHFLAFHPFDYREYALKEYNKRLRRYEI